MSGIIEPPSLTMPATVTATGQVGQPFSQTNEAKGGTPPYTYFLARGDTLPDGTTLDPKTGTVSGRPTKDGAFSYAIKVKDGGKPAQKAASLVSGKIDPPPPPPPQLLTVTSTPSATMTVGQSYSQTNEAKGGTTPYTYEIDGTPPAGTMFDSKTGTVSGTPTTAGPFKYTVKARDSGNPAQTATGSPMSGTIDPPKLTIASTPSSITQVGQSYSQTNEASGGTAPYRYSVVDGTPPSGTTLDDSTGKVSGTPTAPGAFKYTVLVTDSGSGPFQQTAPTNPPVTGAITVRTPLTLTSTPPATTKAGQPYSQTNVASGGTPPYKYSVEKEGTLPAGTKLDDNGTVAGMPTTAGAYSYTIQVTDAGTPTFTASNPVSGTIAAPPTLTLVSMASPMFQVGQSYSQANAGAGGTPPYTYSVSAGALPVGTTLDDKKGTVSGTPTTAGAYSYTIQVKDAGSPTLTATNPVSGPIAPATLTINSVASSIAEVGQLYSQTNVGGGGTSPYIYWVSAGELPAGTTLDPLTGTVSGRPTTAGRFSYKIKIADSCGWWQTTSAVVTGTIAPATLTVTATPSPTTQVRQPYSQLNVASGGTAPYKYSVADGTPPAGTTLDDSTGKVSGTPTAAGAFRYTIRATDSGKPAQTATTSPVSGTIELANLNIISTPSATTQVGQSYSQTNVANGGTPPYTYLLVAGDLPPGTTLNPSTGVVSGTASMAGAFSYTIQAKDNGSKPQTATTIPPVSGTIALPHPTPLPPKLHPHPHPPVHPPCHCWHAGNRHNAQHFNRHHVGSSEYDRRGVGNAEYGRRG